MDKKFTNAAGDENSREFECKLFYDDLACILGMWITFVSSI